MDRIATGDASSDVVVDDPPMAPGARRGNGDQDTLYRRPPAQAPDPVDSSWFADAAGAAVETPAPTPPGFGPTPPSGPGPGRTSFGFSGGPISPVRATPAAGTPAAADAPTQPRELTAAAPLASPSWPAPAAVDPLPVRSAPPPPVRSSSASPVESAGAAVADTPAWRPSDTGSWQTGSGPTGSWQTGGSTPVTDTPAWRPGDTGSWQTGNSVPAADTPARQTGKSVPGADTPAWQAGGSVPAADTPAWRPTDTGSWQRSGTGALSSRELRAPSTTEPSAPSAPLASPRVAETLPPRQPRIVTIGIAVLSAVVLLAGTIIGVVYFSGSDDSLDSVLKLGTTSTDGRVVTAPVDNRSTASFELLAGANVVNVRIGELGDDLYRISTPDDAGIRPSPLLRDDAVQLQVTRDGDGTGGEIDVVLAAKVTWSLRFSGYVQEEHVDLTDGQVAAIDMVGAAKHAELLLPKPSGTVPIKVAGAVEDLTIQSPAGSPVRIQVGGGAQTVVAGTRTLRNVAPGSKLTPKDWATNNRYDVITASRVTALTVESVDR